MHAISGENVINHPTLNDQDDNNGADDGGLSKLVSGSVLYGVSRCSSVGAVIVSADG
jgi:hypothetical protein